MTRLDTTITSLPAVEVLQIYNGDPTGLKVSTGK